MPKGVKIRPDSYTFVTAHDRYGSVETFRNRFDNLAQMRYDLACRMKRDSKSTLGQSPGLPNPGLSVSRGWPGGLFPKQSVCMYKEKTQ